MTEGFYVIIPARLGSTRLPGKVLEDIAGKPLLQHVYESACNSEAEHVAIATDDDQVFSIAKSFDAECIMTSSQHASGTDRLAEAARLLDLPANQVVVNIQGDEMGLPPQLINQLANLLTDYPDAQMATLCERIVDARAIDDPNVVKVVFNKNKKALYFSRSPIPWKKPEANMPFYRHIGMYAYRAGFLQEFAALPKCELEVQESLEQLRALFHGASILIEEACADAGIGIDTKEDLERARKIYSDFQSV